MVLAQAGSAPPHGIAIRLAAVLCISFFQMGCVCPQLASAGAQVSEWVLICLTGIEGVCVSPMP